MGVVPDPVRAGVHNFLINLESPTIFINNVLQGEVGRASGTVTRFVVNSTVGIAGIFDIAAWMGIPYRDDDFGQTLAVYGMGDYPYLLVPVIGPTNPRDLTGKVVDLFLNPTALRYASRGLYYFTRPSRCA
jgi:phospholipid-binding lipoprotein MlaA